ncbi:hypothetical protein [Clostridium sp. AT4]|uniref:hypothetical protein n=1 Tax=Clostridium sp. AT4 TaxID=1720194 RepID=UPI00082E90CF|nr:hypothetical protein [Clostridium sp. AT4]
MAECRPKKYPKLKDYKPSRFMLPTCHYDAAKADRAVTFIENLRHTKSILSILVYTFFSRMFDLMLPPVAKHSIVVA